MGEFSSPTREEPPEKGRPRMDRSTKFVAINRWRWGAPLVFDRLGPSVILGLKHRSLYLVPFEVPQDAFTTK